MTTQRNWHICGCGRCLEDDAYSIWQIDGYSFSLAISYGHIEKGDNCNIGHFFKDYARRRNPVAYRWLEMLGRI